VAEEQHRPGTVRLPVVAVAAVLVVLTAWWPATPVWLGGSVALLVLVRTLTIRPTPASRWRRGWALALVAAAPAGATVGATGWASPLLALTGALVLAGAVATLPRRDPARARELLVEAGLAGGVAAYLLGVLDVGASVVELLAVASGVSACWALAALLLREREQVAAGSRWLLAGLGTVIAAHALPMLVPGAGAVRTGAVAATVGLLAWAMAVVDGDALEPVPAAVTPQQAISPGHVRIVVVGVLAGPVAVASSWLLDPAIDLLPLVLAGGALALVAVLHLLQLVRDHGRRAWRARHDALTGLPSETLFEDRIERAMARGRRTGTGFTVAFLDLDGFKDVNDRHGHLAGDRALQVVAERLRATLREEDTVARRSGDEFLILLEGLGSRAAAERVATKLLGALSSPVGPPGRQHRLGASIGLARWPHDGDDPEELMRRADAAMYEAKGEGSGSIRWFTSLATARTRLRYTLAQQLEAAIAAGEQLELAFHPRVDLRDGRVVELVALVRWRHPQLGLLRPASFLPLAAEAGLAGPVDLGILELACRTAHRWSEDGLLRQLPVTVHVTGESLEDPRFEHEVVEVLRRTGLPATRLGLAVTETALGRGTGTAITNVADLAELGVRTTVVAFGVGAAGIGTLAAVPVKGLELDASLVHGLSRGAVPPVVAAVMAVADRLALSVTASGVGDAEQAERLRAVGCGSARGPYLAPAVLAGTLERRLRGVTAAASGAPLLASDLAGAELAGTERRDVERVLATVSAPAHADEQEEAALLAAVLDRLGGASG
jgi:diguanylate cyclase (GGDEF)-like protein